MRFEGSPMDNKELPAQWKQKVMHGTVEAEGAQIMASDMPPGMGTPGYQGITVSLYIKQDVDKARKAFEALAAGGQVTMPFAPPFWGGHFGMFSDRFGVPKPQASVAGSRLAPHSTSVTISSACGT